MGHDLGTQRVTGMGDAKLLEICNEGCEHVRLSPLELAAMDELMRRGVVCGASGSTRSLGRSDYCSDSHVGDKRVSPWI